MKLDGITKLQPFCIKWRLNELHEHCCNFSKTLLYLLHECCAVEEESNISPSLCQLNYIAKIWGNIRILPHIWSHKTAVLAFIPVGKEETKAHRVELICCKRTQSLWMIIKTWRQPEHWTKHILVNVNTLLNIIISISRCAETSSRFVSAGMSGNKNCLPYSTVSFLVQKKSQ